MDFNIDVAESENSHQIPGTSDRRFHDESQEAHVELRHVSRNHNMPLGIRLMNPFFSNQEDKRSFHKYLILFVTFVTYACYHLGRRPLSIVKNVFNRNCTEVKYFIDFNKQPSLATDNEITYYNISETDIPSNSTTWCDWPPFDDDATAHTLLALLDSAFLFSYAIFMFFSGFLADRCNLRYFLTFGLMSSGFLLYAFGMAFYINSLQSMSYFLIIQVLSGAMHTTGWPAVVTCVGNWFGPSSRGLVFGIWNSHTNIGNILGAAVAGYFVEKSWGLSFMIPGLILLTCGVFVFLFLVPRPEDVGLSNETSMHYNASDVEDTITYNEEIINDFTSTTRRKPHKIQSDDELIETNSDNNLATECENRPLIDSEENQTLNSRSNEEPVSFRTCLKIPGVIEYALCLFFSKLVSYTFLYWLPKYISESTQHSSEDSAYLSTPFDIGGIIGAISAGYLSDIYKASGTVCSIMLILAIPAMFLYEKLASISNYYNIILQIVAGTLVNGPYALITTTVSTDLGDRIKNGKAMATVVAIIDGTGSIGAALGPLIAGIVADSGWNSVFIMCMLSDLLASIFLVRIMIKEIKHKLASQ